MSYSDEYDVSDLPELGGEDQSHGGGFGGPGSSSHEKSVRRRSSKACDQCRKSKCKCERTSANEPCKSCIMLGTPCTFLGPSRKRGPPKGYIDAIEARLHQTEALVGIMLATKDPRAHSLLEDLAKDPLAKEIISRVDNSPYGVKGRKHESGGASKPRPPGGNSGSDSSTPKDGTGKIDLTSTHPSNEWQDNVIAMLNVAAGFEADKTEGAQDALADDRDEGMPGASGSRPPLRIVPPRPASSETHSSDENQSPAVRRQRRRIGEHDFSSHGLQYPSSANASSLSLATSASAVRRRGRAFSHTYSSLSPVHPMNQERRSSSSDSLSSDSEDELTGAVGQLSLNEDEQVRYHGKASGLHILHNKERVDGRNEGGIWRFPKARVWPPAPDAQNTLQEDDHHQSQLPDQATQNRLLDIYFRNVHSAFPVIHKRSFFNVYKKTHSHSSESDDSPGFNRRPRRIPTLLLLTIFAIAARYDSSGNPPPSDPTVMWSAGDDYLDAAKIILDQSYSSSRLSTCQALLLMGYREVGIGAMAQAWTYIGMAIRMAQDLGMHRGADGWARVDLGGRLFSEWELQERKRIWYGCVIMDKYISTYIGRPLMIFERDFDTPLPSEDDPEELEEWVSPSPTDIHVPVPSYRISCFNASSTLSGILSTIVQAIYAVRPVSSRHAESAVLEGLLDKWYLDLPEHLRYDPNGSNKVTPVPHVLTLHMQYWCAVVLLHRPFIRNIYNKPRSGDEGDDAEVMAIATKNYELCASAANHISVIISAYAEKYPLDRCSVFLCYYLFTACIMHVTTLTTYPSDPQANMGLKKCMDALEMMATVWPSAQRALVLLRGAKVNLQASEYQAQSTSTIRPKRSAENNLNDSDSRRYFPAHLNGAPPYQSASTSRAEVPSNYLYPTIEAYTQPPANHQPTHPSPIAPTPPTTAYRWHTENLHSQPSFHTPNTPLSTSVLPQVYSTGFGEERPHPTHHRTHSYTDHHPQHVARYPQYWNDYSTFPQLGPAYTGIPDNHTTAPHPQLNSQAYTQEHYNIYGQHSGFSER
ncbi:hypothetical protein D9611_008569 [Ephemerocybe angulata]|uniref:Zn(2)-C6 fungal-type domain-containing protein n=1 Tax=Ephemerocybe angulata TaxID=980116 RepID=A0A8H5AYH3_9AGAR|nr:hypothetical protein D9611_008569 [Tulosesus angulatus]